VHPPVFLLICSLTLPILCPSNLLCHDIGCEVLDGYKASQLLSMSEDDLAWKLMKLGTQWTNNLGRFEHGTLRL